MMNEKLIYAGIDWYTGTLKYSQLDSLAPTNTRSADALATKIITENEALELATFDVDLRPRPFYEYSYSDGNGVTLSLSARQSQGVKIEISGQDWSIGEAHEYEQYIALQRQEWKPTRIDVAFDFMNFGFSTVKIWEAGMKEQAYAKRRKASLITSGAGSTLSIGSRTSEKYLRLYEKGMEQRTGQDWYRAEIELKGRTAQAYAQTYTELLKHSASAIRQLAHRLPEEMQDFFVDFGSGDATPKIGRKRTSSNRRKWLMTQILPILKEERDKNSETWRMFIEALAK